MSSSCELPLVTIMVVPGLEVSIDAAAYCGRGGIYWGDDWNNECHWLRVEHHLVEPLRLRVESSISFLIFDVSFVSVHSL